VTGERLAAALEAFAEAETPDTRWHVLDALANADLIFPTAERGPGEQSVRLAFTQDDQGRPVLPGFTDESHLRVWLPGGGPYAKAAPKGFLPSVLAGPFVGLVLNPGSEASALVDRRALELLASGNPSSVSTGADGALVRRWL
jgi:SseB protein N-terminal domain